MRLKRIVKFTVNKDEFPQPIENAEHSGWLTASTDTDEGKYSSLIQIPNQETAVCFCLGGRPMMAIRSDRYQYILRPLQGRGL